MLTHYITGSKEIPMPDDLATLKAEDAAKTICQKLALEAGFTEGFLTIIVTERGPSGTRTLHPFIFDVRKLAQN